MKDKFEVREFALSRLTFKTVPVPEFDEYEIGIYWKGAYITSVKVDGLELECFRHGDSEENEWDFNRLVDCLFNIFSKLDVKYMKNREN